MECDCRKGAVDPNCERHASSSLEIAPPAALLERIRLLTDEKRKLAEIQVERNKEFAALRGERDALREALEQALADLEAILPPRGHEELAQGVYFAHKRIERALGESAE